MFSKEFVNFLTTETRCKTGSCRAKREKDTKVEF